MSFFEKILGRSEKPSEPEKKPEEFTEADEEKWFEEGEKMGKRKAEEFTEADEEKWFEEGEKRSKQREEEQE